MASIIGAGNPKTILKRLMETVFFKSLKKYGLLKKTTKCLKPTHLLLKIPRLALYSLKAMIRPYMGL
jgi:hypothetical protein